MDSSDTFLQPAEPFASSSMLPFGAGPALDVCHSPLCQCVAIQTPVMHRNPHLVPVHLSHMGS